MTAQGWFFVFLTAIVSEVKCNLKVVLIFISPIARVIGHFEKNIYGLFVFLLLRTLSLFH
jgi:Na+/H+ antiporter NhaD/arsenite permease-like protein